MGLEYIYAALLLHEAKQDINVENVKKVLEAAGVQPNEAMINALVTALEGIDIEQLKKESLVAPVAQVAPAQVQEEAKPEEKKEEKKAEEEQKKQEEALSGLGALFGL